MNALLMILQVCTISVALALGTLLLSLKQSRVIHRWLAVLAFAAGFWALGILLFLQQSGSRFSEVYVQLYFVAALFVPVALYYFSLYYPHQRSLPAKRLVPVAILSAIVTGVIIVPGFLVASIQPHASFLNLGVASFHAAPYWLYLAVYGLVSALALGNLFYSYRSTLEAGARETARYVCDVFWSALTATVCIVVFTVALPMLGQSELIWAGPPFIVILAVYIFYVMVLQGLFDVRAALARSVAYAIVVAATVSLYAAALFSMSDLLFDYNPPDTLQLLFYIIMALVLLVTLRPLQLLIDRATHKIFYQNEYQIDETLQKLAAVTANEIELRRIVKGSLDVLYEAIHPEYASLYLLSSEGKTYHFGRSDQRRLHREHRRQLRVVSQVIDELPQILRRSDIITLEERKVMNKADAAMIVQLVVRGEHLGVLFLGERRSGARYGDKEMQLLQTASSELALAIQNGLRFEEVQQFNKRLRSEVLNATRQLRRSNRQLHKLDEAKDDFLSIASHQLRTPLTSVKGYLSMLLDGDAGTLTQQQQYLAEEAFSSSQRMVGLIEDFLNLSRLQTGRFTIDKGPVDMRQMVAEEVAALEGVAAARKLTLKAILADDIPAILMVDEGKLRQVVMNFIDNALYYSHADTTVSVRLSRSNGRVRLVVQDTGIGVPVKEQARLFTKFYRASNARKQRPDGTGVGLYLAKKVITEHGGEIIVRSTEGEGSTFGFTLPIAELLPAKHEAK